MSTFESTPPRQREMLLAIGAVLCLLSGCLLDGGDDPEFMTRRLYVRSLSVTSVSVREVQFVATCVNPDCYRHLRTDVSRDGGEVSISIWGRRNKAWVCPDVVTEFDVAVRVAIPGPGDYAFRFLITDSTSVDTTLTVSPS